MTPESAMQVEADIELGTQVGAENDVEGTQVNPEVVDVEGMQEGGADTLIDWAKMCSQHLSFLERRKMESQFLGHEVVRQMNEIWSQFRPPPRGDWTWLLRKAQDFGVRALRAIVTHSGPRRVRRCLSSRRGLYA